MTYNKVYIVLITHSLHYLSNSIVCINQTEHWESLNLCFIIEIIDHISANLNFDTLHVPGSVGGPRDLVNIIFTT